MHFGPFLRLTMVYFAMFRKISIFAVRFREVAQLVSARVWGARGRWFESSLPDERSSAIAGLLFLLDRLQLLVTCIFPAGYEHFWPFLLVSCRVFAGYEHFPGLSPDIGKRGDGDANPAGGLGAEGFGQSPTERPFAGE